LLAQCTKTDGGIAIFTAMNADGDFYTGNKKVNSATGQEEVFDAPIPTVTGEDPGIGGVNVGFDVLTPLEASISRSLRVEGGPDSNIVSEFDGPVVFNNKITSTSLKGIEANSLYLQGDVDISRKYTVGISTPSFAGNPGDVQYNSNPSNVDYLGWVYTSSNEWQKFGKIGIGVGYASGSGGSVIQTGARTNTVTLNALTGSITTFNKTTTSGLVDVFTVSNNLVDATDTIIVSHKSGGSAGQYIIYVAEVNSGSFKIAVYTPSAQTSAASPVINFSIIKVASS